MSYPWANIDKLEPVKLEEIMSEEVARNVQAKEEQYLVKFYDKICTAGVNGTPPKNTTHDSESESNKEHDQLEIVEEKCSGSYVDNFSRLSLNGDFDCDSEEEGVVDILDEKDWETFDSLGKGFACVSQSVFKKNKTPEYATVRREKNTCKLSSKVFNSLEPSSYNEEFRRYKVYRDKKKRTAEKVSGIDQHAWRLIRKMVNDRVVNKVTGVISYGKDGVTLKANYSCAIKVFKINLKIDNGHGAACHKAQREEAIYKRLKASGISSLEVISRKEHILFTSFPGQILKDAYYYPHGYEIVRNLMKKFYEANLIHTDLSERNILIQIYTMYIINVSQCVDRNHKNAFHFLFKGCTNIVNFYRRSYTVCPDELFKYITGYSYLDKQSFLELQKSIKTETV